MSSKVNIARVLHLLEQAQICVAVFHLRNHGGPVARKEDNLSGMDCVDSACFRGAVLVRRTMCSRSRPGGIVLRSFMMVLVMAGKRSRGVCAAAAVSGTETASDFDSEMKERIGVRV